MVAAGPILSANLVGQELASLHDDAQEMKILLEELEVIEQPHRR